MKKVLLLLYLFGAFMNSNVRAQNNGQAAAALVGVGITGLALAMSIHQYIEKLELDATEYLLRTKDDAELFTIKVMDLADGVKVSDLSNISCLAFSVNFLNKDLTSRERNVLLLFTSRGWISDNGININLVKYKLLTRKEWNDIYVSYINCASNFSTKFTTSDQIEGLTLISKSVYKENDSTFIKIVNSNRSISYYKKGSYPIGKANLSFGGVTFSVPNSPKIPFRSFNGDTYSVVDFSPEFKVLYNEESLGLYIKQMDKLVQLKRKTMNAIHKFVNN